MRFHEDVQYATVTDPERTMCASIFTEFGYARNRNETLLELRKVRTTARLCQEGISGKHRAPGWRGLVGANLGIRHRYLVWEIEPCGFESLAVFHFIPGNHAVADGDDAVCVLGDVVFVRHQHDRIAFGV